MSEHDENTSAAQQSSESRLWTFLNSNFGLFVLSSIVLSFITWAYTEVSQSIEHQKVTMVSVTKLTTEMSYRIRLIENYFVSECSEDSNLSPQTFVDIQDIYRAKPTYQSIFPENKEKDLHILLWELGALSDGDEQNAFFDSFNSMLNFNSFLNRLRDQTSTDGNFYGEKPDYEKRVEELVELFSAATRPIAHEIPGIGTITKFIPPSIASPSLALPPGDGE